MTNVLNYLKLEKIDIQKVCTFSGIIPLVLIPVLVDGEVHH